MINKKKKRISNFKVTCLGNTTMDATLSFVMANMAQCQLNHIALDPFCGTGKSSTSCSLNFF